MMYFIGNLGSQWTKRIIGQFGCVDDCVDLAKILEIYPANVHRKSLRRGVGGLIERSFTVEAGIETRYGMSHAQQFWPKQ